MDNVRQIIETAYNKINEIKSTDIDLKKNVNLVINTLDCGGVRVAENIGGNWITHDWIKKAILLSFKLNQNQVTDASWTKFYDKINLKFTDYTPEMFTREAFRIVPGAIVRKGAYIAKNTVIMPSYVNIGAYIGSGSMIDTWATVGSCAQIGNNVHISGGVGIGGVLEPLQNNPTIIEDECFIGARSEVVEGVIIGHGSILSMGVYIGKSTKIYDRTTKTISYGYIPPYSVVIPGNLPSEDKTHSIYAAIIIKKVDSQTRAKVSINELLRE
ncbi:MAG: 2,3,4,5-tetrahydropyridine-2,6-dicarboxylate N-succinyltransferase [Burkholderiales bacterium]|nr:2,3,4,5-tetrahydropyridine-2,6-dicarboxylate N-succinyltransferase [Burkholderiales bacterium]